MKESGVSVKIAEKTADQMIEVAAKYAKKWGRTSSVGFVTTYDMKKRGVTVMNEAQLVKYFTKQKKNLIDIIENGGVVEKGVVEGPIKKGTTFDLTDRSPEDIAFDIFLRNMFRLGIAVAASSKNGEKILLKVFRKHENFRADNVRITSEENGGISSEISAIARVTPTNLKPAFQQGVAGWEKLFKKMDKAAELTEREEPLELLDDENDAGKILDIDCAEEGSPKYREHLIRERNRTLILKKKKSATSLSCEVCGFDFKKFYGDLGENFCEVHHKIPLSKLNESAKTELADLAIVCSNCHRMLHRRRDDVFTIAELRKKIKKKMRR